VRRTADDLESGGLSVAKDDGQNGHDEAQQGDLNGQEGGVETSSLIRQACIQVAVNGVDRHESPQRRGDTCEDSQFEVEPKLAISCHDAVVSVASDGALSYW
jgi:hypothetical protein